MIRRATALLMKSESGDMGGGFRSLALFPAREPRRGERETAKYSEKDAAGGLFRHTTRAVRLYAHGTLGFMRFIHRDQRRIFSRGWAPIAPTWLSIRKPRDNRESHSFPFQQYVQSLQGDTPVALIMSSSR